MCLLLSIYVAYAAYWVFSPSISGTVTSYQLTLTKNSEWIFNSTANFTSQLTKNGLPMGNEPIVLLKKSGAIIVDVDVQLTNASGYARFSVNVSDPEGTPLEFWAGWLAP
jgi:hypothetical protein